jgi:hypothetical protein
MNTQIKQQFTRIQECVTTKQLTNPHKSVFNRHNNTTNICHKILNIAYYWWIRLLTFGHGTNEEPNFSYFDSNA